MKLQLFYQVILCYDKNNNNLNLSKGHFIMQKIFTSTKYISTFTTLAFLAVLLYFLNTNQSTNPISKTELVLGTVSTITIYDSNNIDHLDKCFEICREYEKIFSTTDTDSELYQLNQTFELQSKESILISKELFTLLESSIHYSQISNGSFDPTIAPLSLLWNFSNSTTPPSDSQISKNLQLIGYKNITCSNNTVSNNLTGIKLDLGGIAKGYIADRLKDYLISQDIQSAIIDLGGNILCIGEKQKDTPFRIAIKKPFDTSSPLATLSIKDKSIVTCGIYERYYEYNDILYHHILDPKTGYPVQNNLHSVTIISNDSITADALSTTCFCLGLENTITLLEEFPDVHAIFVTNDNQIITTPNLENDIKIEF